MIDVADRDAIIAGYGQLMEDFGRIDCVFANSGRSSRGGSVLDRLVEAVRQVEGAFSLIALAKGMVMGVRDPLGVRPLVLGRCGGAPGVFAGIGVGNVYSGSSRLVQLIKPLPGISESSAVLGSASRS